MTAKIKLIKMDGLGFVCLDIGKFEYQFDEVSYNCQHPESDRHLTLWMKNTITGRIYGNANIRAVANVLFANHVHISGHSHIDREGI